jgi:hypothetical protein
VKGINFGVGLMGNDRVGLIEVVRVRRWVSMQTCFTGLAEVGGDGVGKFWITEIGR